LKYESGSRDIAMCMGHDCKQRENCHRYIDNWEKLDGDQWILEPIRESDKCFDFWPSTRLGET